MKSLVAVCIALCVCAGRAEDVPKCPSETAQVTAELEEQAISHDIFNHLLGRHLTLWGPQAVLEKDNTTKFDFLREKVNEKEFSQVMYISGLKLGNQTRNSTWTKADNGVYIVKSSGKVFAKVYNFFNENNITAQYTCLINPASEEVLPPFFTTLTAPTDMIMAGTLGYQSFKTVVDITKKIEAKPQLYGPIAAYDFSQVY